MDRWLDWLKQHKPWTWVFSGVGVALIGWVFGWITKELPSTTESPPPSTSTQAQHGVAGGGKITVGDGGAVVGGDNIVTIYYGDVSEVHEAVPPEDLDSTFRTIAERFKALDEKLATFTSDDPEVKAPKKAARETLEQSEFDRAEELVNQASVKDVEAARTMPDSQILISSTIAKPAPPIWKQTTVSFFEKDRFSICSYNGFSGTIEQKTSLLLKSNDRSIPGITVRGFDMRVPLNETVELWPGCRITAGFSDVVGVLRVYLKVELQEKTR